MEGETLAHLDSPVGAEGATELSFTSIGFFAAVFNKAGGQVNEKVVTPRQLRSEPRNRRG